jgi:hypothetical protein
LMKKNDGTITDTWQPSRWHFEFVSQMRYILFLE